MQTSSAPLYFAACVMLMFALWLFYLTLPCPFLFIFFATIFCMSGNARGWAMFPDVVVLVPNKELCEQVRTSVFTRNVATGIWSSVGCWSCVCVCFFYFDHTDTMLRVFLPGFPELRWQCFSFLVLFVETINTMEQDLTNHPLKNGSLLR